MDNDTRNFTFEARQIILGHSRLLPEKRHLEALESVIRSQDIAIKELQATLMEVLDNTESIDQQLNDAQRTLDGIFGPMRES